MKIQVISIIFNLNSIFYAKNFLFYFLKFPYQPGHLRGTASLKFKTNFELFKVIKLFVPESLLLIAIFLTPTFIKVEAIFFLINRFCSK